MIRPPALPSLAARLALASLALSLARPAAAASHRKAASARAASVKAAPAGPATALAGRVQRYYQRARDFSADFAQRYTYVAFGRTDEKSGKVHVKRPGMARWDYEKPDAQSMILDGKTLWIWQPVDRQATVRRNFGGAQLSSAFTFLWGRGDLLGEFEPRAVPVPAGLPAGEGLELTPRKPAPGIARLLFVVGKDGQVLASVVTSPSGDVNQMVFSGAHLDSGVPDSMFHFEPPRGAFVQEQ